MTNTPTNCHSEWGGESKILQARNFADTGQTLPKRILDSSSAPLRQNDDMGSKTAIALAGGEGNRVLT